MNGSIRSKKVWALLIFILIFTIFIENSNINPSNFFPAQKVENNEIEKENENMNNVYQKQVKLPQIAQSSTNVIEIISKNDTLIRKDGLNQTVEFYFNDTKNNKPIYNLTTKNIIVKDNQTKDGSFKIRTGGNYDQNWTLYNFTGKSGYYKLNVSTKGLNSGWIRLELNASYSINWSIAYIDFYLRGNLTRIEFIQMLDPSFKVSWFTSFLGYNLTVQFDMIDLDFKNQTITDRNQQAVVSIEYINKYNNEQNGSLSNDISYNLIGNFFEGTIGYSKILKIGSYDITFLLDLTNYYLVPESFPLEIIEQYHAQIQIIDKPTEIIAGESFTVIVSAQYNIESDIYNLTDGTIIMTIYLSEDNFTMSRASITKANGFANFVFIIPVAIKTKNLTFNLILESDYYHKSALLNNINIKIISFQEFNLIFILFLGTIIGIIIYLFIIYRDEILPKKIERRKILNEIVQTIKDVETLEYIFIFNKDRGICLFFRSLNWNEINIEEIDRILSIIYTFGKEEEYQDVFNESDYNDKNILISDGKCIRVSLIMKGKSSINMKDKLNKFIYEFEKNQEEMLKECRIDLNFFKNIKILLDKILNISNNLPYEINNISLKSRSLENMYSKVVLKTAEDFENNSERKFFFISNLLQKEHEINKSIIEYFMNIKDKNFFFISSLVIEVYNKIGKDLEKIFIAINELKEKEIIVPINISFKNSMKLSKQELDNIRQNANKLTGLSSEARDVLINELYQMNPIERDVIIRSMTMQQRITSPPIFKK